MNLYEYLSCFLIIYYAFIFYYPFLCSIKLKFYFIAYCKNKIVKTENL